MAPLGLHRHLLQLPLCPLQCCRFITRAAEGRRAPAPFPILRGDILPIHKHVYEANSRNSETCRHRYLELLQKVKEGGGENAILRHTQRNKKLLVRERLKMLLDDENFLELSPFAGLGLPYGDVPSAGCLSGIGKICGIWCVFIANDATVKGGTAYPISVKKQLRAQEIAMQNRLPAVYMVDSGGAFLPLQAQLFPDKEHGGRTFYNEAIMSAMKIPQVAVVCGSCTAGGAYIPTMTDEAIIVDKIGTIFLAGPPLVKAATGEEVSAEDLGGAKLHSRVSGCVDHFAAAEPEAYNRVRCIVSTLNFDPTPEEHPQEYEDPLYDTSELAGLAPRAYSLTLDAKLILSRLVDGSRFLEFKADFGTTIVTGFAYIEGNLVGIVASNGVLTHDASLKGSHFVQICNHRNIPLLFLQNTTSQDPTVTSVSQAEVLTNRLKAQASMMAAVACASVPKLTLIIGGCHGGESFAMCGRSFQPNFLFLWPNARIGLVDADSFPRSRPEGVESSEDEEEFTDLVTRLKEESSAFYSSARIWDDGVILPEDTRHVLGKCLRIIGQQKYERPAVHSSPMLRM
ncbi:methylcrotonoyl-CoA carboxylase beta chain, mitochondrial-like [Hyperolius riggenbachi]|uniref:methylcrotonoyl-CoA carboxylase beta chain, mitochondrial-like n=1 Tax=Hyperolius riggenbachi TaxID=752182 RepID=UPI0035A2A63A